jgi:dGTPase
VERLYPGLAERRMIHEVVRRMINEVVTDLIDTTRARIAAQPLPDVEAVRALGHPLVGFSERVAAEHRELKRFLNERVYRHFRVVRMTTKAQRIVRELFRAYFDDLRLLPDEHRDAARRLEAMRGTEGRARAVADYIAGMTDRYAILEHGRLYDPSMPQG